MSALDLAAELLRHCLLAVADAEHRHASFVDRGRRERRPFFVDGGRTAGQNYGLRLHRLEGLVGFLERDDLGIDALLAHASRDQLGDLRAEIDDEEFVVVGWCAAHSGF